MGEVEGQGLCRLHVTSPRHCEPVFPHPDPLGGTGPRDGVRVWSPSLLRRRPQARRGVGGACSPREGSTRFRRDRGRPSPTQDRAGPDGGGRGARVLVCQPAAKMLTSPQRLADCNLGPHSNPLALACPARHWKRLPTPPHLPQGQPGPPPLSRGWAGAPTYCDITQVRPTGLPAPGLEVEGAFLTNPDRDPRRHRPHRVQRNRGSSVLPPHPCTHQTVRERPGWAGAELRTARGRA